MYSKQEIAYLLKSGFSLSDIMALDTGVAPETAPATEQPPEAAPAPEVVKKPVKAPKKPVQTNSPEQVQEPAQEPETVSNAVVLAAIEHLTNAVHSANMRAGGFAAPSGEATADSILANIINPPGYSGNK